MAHSDEPSLGEWWVGGTTSSTLYVLVRIAALEVSDQHKLLESRVWVRDRACDMGWEVPISQDFFQPDVLFASPNSR